MKNNYILFALLFVSFFVSSCIQEEAPNAECDIVSVDTTQTWFRENRNILTNELKVNNDQIIFKVKKDTEFNTINITHESIINSFSLTPGARIEAYSGNESDKKGVKKDNNGIHLWYTVHAEDGIWSKDYDVMFIKMPVLDTDHVFSFENFETEKFTNWYEINKDGIRSDIWASGNPGFKMTAGTRPASEYPTATYDKGFSGDCVKLTTCDTGKFGSMAKMPIAAGSIFIGEFDNANAMKEKEKATHFGLQIIPERSKPVALKGYYKYTSGDDYKDKNNNPVEGVRDECSIYAVLFEIDPNNFVPLDGSNITSSERIVLMADLKDAGEPEDWTEFNIPFEPMNGKGFDFGKLENNEYAITIVASSSKNGAFFEGAVGSTLCIDELKIEWEKQ